MTNMQGKDLFAIQKQLEEESVSLGVARYEKFRENNSESETGPGQRLVGASIDSVAKAISEFIAEANTGKPGKRHSAVQYLQHVNPAALAYLTATVCVSQITLKQKPRLAAASILVGAAVQHELNFALMQDKAPGLHRVIQRQVKKATSDRHRVAVMNKALSGTELSKLDLPLTTLSTVGLKLIELFIGATGLLSIVNIRKGHKTESFLQGDEKTLEWLESAHKSASMFTPVLQPMVVPPRPWVSPTEGGYLSNLPTANVLVRTRNKAYLAELAHADMPKVYEALNAIQGTAWKVNTSILAVMKEAWEMGGGIGGLPDRELEELPARPAMLDSDPEFYKEHHKDEFKAWKGARAAVYENNTRSVSKRVAAAQKIELAEKFSEFPAIYFPHNLDFRGRIYPIPSQLNPQSDDQGKALLQFAEGVPLGERGAFWLAVHVANCFGVDKVPFDDRLAWVEKHEDQILDSALSPLDGQRFWVDADSPWCALAACMEWLGYKLNGTEHLSRIPVAMDGSCNGLQNFSAMLRDPIGGKATNLIPSATPADIYTEVLKVVERKLSERAVGGCPNAIRLSGRLTRNVCKTPVMTLPYGVTKPGMRDQILKSFPDAGIEDDWHLAEYLSTLMWDSIGEVVVAARHAMDWLKDAAKTASSGGHPVSWTTPAGFPVMQDYREVEGKRVSVHLGGKQLNIIVAITGNKLSGRRQALGIAPNFVHSCDSSHLMLTTVAAKTNGICSFAMIHDSFGTHAGNTDVLAAALRAAFIEQYSPDVLGAFRDELAEQLPKELVEKLPRLPGFGTLDLNAVHESKYFFA